MSQSLIFDFDGTLINSEVLIRETFIKVTKKIAPNRLNYAKNILIGPPLRATSIQILGSKYEYLIDNFINDFIESHDKEILIHTEAYENTNYILNKLYQLGHKMAIATNKRKVPTIKIINHFKWNKFFIFIECSDSEMKIREKGLMIQSIIKKDKGFNNSFLVGDTLNDAVSANQNNLQFIKATYGYGSKQDWASVKIYKSINKIEDIIKYIN